VSRLIRIRYGRVMLPRGLKRGAWLELDERDVRALMQAAGAEVPRGDRQGEGDGGGRGRRRRGGRGGNKDGQSRGPGQQGQGQGQQRRKERGDRDRPAGGQPDPMKTSFGYIGADSFTRQRQGQGQPGQRRGGGGKRGGRGR
jgi:23S rRNA pseudouridine2605 synthase